MQKINVKKNFVVVLVLVVLSLLIVFSYFSFFSNEDKKYSSIFGAISQGDLQAVRDFIRKNPKLVNTPKYDGFMPLNEAIFHGNIEIIKLLIDKGADVNTEDGFGYTPLEIAYMKQKNYNQDYTKIIKLLKKHGAEVGSNSIYQDYDEDE